MPAVSVQSSAVINASNARAQLHTVQDELQPRSTSVGQRQACTRCGAHYRHRGMLVLHIAHLQLVEAVVTADSISQRVQQSIVVGR